MVWYNLKIGVWNARYTPINPKKNEFIDVDKDGNELTKVKGSYTRGHFVNEVSGEEHKTAFKLIKGKACAKLSKTKEVGNFIEVDVRECEDLIVEKEYLIECEGLLNDLKSSGKALKFAFCSGNGYKVYFAYAKPSIYKGFLAMICGTTTKSEMINDIIDLKTQQKKSVELTIQGVDRAKVEDLIEL